MDNHSESTPTLQQSLATARLANWLLGLSVLAAVIVAAVSLADEREFVRVAEQARPIWLGLALLLQLATYLAQGQILRAIAAAGRRHLSIVAAFRLSLAKLFVDQALPSGGFSGAVLTGRILTRRGVPRDVVLAGSVSSIAAFYLSYVVALAAAWATLALAPSGSRTAIFACFFFLVVSAVLAAGILLLAGRPLPASLQRLTKFKAIKGFATLLEVHDRRLTRNVRWISRATTWQLATIALDSLTVWALVRASGESAGLGPVITGFVLASAVRTIGVVPGGLGTFEATLVWILNAYGTPLAAGLTAVLLFRGLSFWLPMLPGLWFYRQESEASANPADSAVPPAYWAVATDVLLQKLGASSGGLSSEEANKRQIRFGRNEIKESVPLTRLAVLAGQFKSPLLLLLIFAAFTSVAVGGWSDAVIVAAIVLASAGIGFAREYSARAAAAAMRERVQITVRAVRDGKPELIAVSELVQGDLILLSAGCVVPADGIVLEASDCFVNEAILTGESFPVQKRPDPTPAESILADRTNCVFMGSNVRSGTARCLVVNTGRRTEFGAIARRLEAPRPDTQFDRGLKRFGYLLTTAMLWIILAVFAVHMVRGRPPVETLLFSVALAVGLSPELLPFILSLNLARGAQMMAKQGVLVRRLNAIENLGGMNILCTDKTGTLTEGVVRVEGAFDSDGAPCEKVRRLAEINASMQTGLANPLDDAILTATVSDLSDCRKLAEIPFDFSRKRLSVIVRTQEGIRLISKGAFQHVMDACSRTAEGRELNSAKRAELERLFESWSAEGVRVIGIAARAIAEQQIYTRDDERDMEFVGFLTFSDRPKDGVKEAMSDLATLGVSVKVITGDHRLVAQHVARLVGMHADRVLTGAEIDLLKDEALWREADRTDLFVEVDPNQKERIIRALQRLGNVVGFLGDGVNDAPAMNVADAALSVEHAVDVAREAADFVLLERNLDVIRMGIVEGRRTFVNTLKYILTTTSANLGNMISMAAASLFLPFLPLLSGQILLNNFLSDIPAFGLANDTVDDEAVERPRSWDVRFVGRFMLGFGALSSAFDVATFALLLVVFHAGADAFRTGWFVESLLTELAVAFVVRTRRSMFRSRPGTLLLASSVILALLAPAVPYLPFVQVLGFVPLPATLTVSLIGITMLYVACAERLKEKVFAWCESPRVSVSPTWHRGLQGTPRTPK